MERQSGRRKTEDICSGKKRVSYPLEDQADFGTAHMTEHEEPSLSPLGFLTVRATRAASVKASLTPRFFMAEHSVEMIVSFPASCCFFPRTS